MSPPTRAGGPDPHREPPASTSITATARKRDHPQGSGAPRLRRADTVTDPVSRALADLATVPADVPLGFWRGPDGQLSDIPVTVADAREGLLDGTTDPAAVIGTLNILCIVGVLPGGAA